MLKTKSLIPCVGCGKDFAGRIRTDGKQKKFCSPRCLQEYRKILRNCVQCGCEFTTYDDKKHCSWKCYSLSRPLKLVSYTCPTCGVSFKRDVAQDSRKDKDPNRKRFCSERCAGIGRRGEANPMFRGRRKAYRGTTWLEQKKRIHSMFFRCRFCETEIDGQGRHVDHIVPWRIAKLGKRDPNDDRNLWVLCRGCHAKKTHAEAVLFREGRKQYEIAVMKIAGREDARGQLKDAFEYCGITDVKSMTVVVLRKAKKRSAAQKQNELVFV